MKNIFEIEIGIPIFDFDFDFEFTQFEIGISDLKNLVIEFDPNSINFKSKFRFSFQITDFEFPNSFKFGR